MKYNHATFDLICPTDRPSPRQLINALESINIEKSGATLPEDQKEIFRILLQESTNFIEINCRIIKILKNWYHFIILEYIYKAMIILIGFYKPVSLFVFPVIAFLYLIYQFRIHSGSLSKYHLHVYLYTIGDIFLTSYCVLYVYFMVTRMMDYGIQWVDDNLNMLADLILVFSSFGFLFRMFRRLQLFDSQIEKLQKRI